jgi:hypothetical protein
VNFPSSALTSPSPVSARAESSLQSRVRLGEVRHGHSKPRRSEASKTELAKNLLVRNAFTLGDRCFSLGVPLTLFLGIGAHRRGERSEATAEPGRRRGNAYIEELPSFVQPEVGQPTDEAHVSHLQKSTPYRFSLQRTRIHILRHGNRPSAGQVPSERVEKPPRPWRLACRYFAHAPEQKAFTGAKDDP